MRKRIIVDTSVWSLKFRRSVIIRHHSTLVLENEIKYGSEVILLGIVLQELLQGVKNVRDHVRLRNSLSAFSQSTNTIAEHIAASEIVNTCRWKGIQISTIDSLIAAAALQRECFLLTADKDFRHIAKHFPLKLI